MNTSAKRAQTEIKMLGCEGTEGTISSAEAIKINEEHRNWLEQSQQRVALQKNVSDWGV